MGVAASKVTNTARSRASNSLEEKTQQRPSSSSSLPTSQHPTSPQGTVSLAVLDSWETELAQNPNVLLARTVLPHTGLKAALASRAAVRDVPHVFSHTLERTTAPVTDQKSSGRCWLFATTNVARYEVTKRLRLKEFQFSQSYLFFWDKLNKANYYLELSLELADRPVDDRLVNFLASDLVSDGGQWDMVVNLLETYGLVPQSVYPETFHSSASSVLNTLVKSKLREHATILRELAASLRAGVKPGSVDDEQRMQDLLRAKKEELMQEIYSVLTAALGVPPRPDAPFQWEYYDEKDKYGKWEGTPTEFYRAFSGNCPAAECFSLINDPRNEYGKLYTVDKLGNVWGGRPVLYVNTKSDDLKAAVVRSIKAGHPVFFGCDVGKSSDSANGIGVMDLDYVRYQEAFNITLGMTKAQRLETNESSMTHAMVISGAHLDEKTDKPTRFRVENSWGENSGHKGYMVMTDRWFDEFVYQVVVHKSFAPKELVKVFESGERIVLPAWDPMGALA